MTTDIAQLSFAIDSSQAAQATRNLEGMKAAAAGVTEGQRKLDQALQDGRRSVVDYGEKAALLTSSLTAVHSALDGVVERANKATGALRDSASAMGEFQTAMRGLDGLARSFEMSASGLEGYARSARQAGLASNETLTALQNIQAAFEGVTAKGQQARAVLENYGLSVRGLDRNQAGNVMTQFISRMQTFADDPQRLRDAMTVMGPLGADTVTRLSYPDYRSTEQQRREAEAHQRAQNTALAREGIFRLNNANSQMEGRYGELRGLWGEGEAGLLSRMFGEGDSGRRQRLEEWERQYQGYKAGDRVPAWMALQRENKNTLWQRFDTAWSDWRDYRNNGESEANAELINAQYQRDRLNGGWWEANMDWAGRRIGNLFSADQAGIQQILDNLPADQRPVNPRIAAYQRQTGQMAFAGAMSPDDQRRMQPMMAALQGFGVDIGRLEGFSPAALRGLDDKALRGFGILPEHMAAIDQRFAAEDDTRLLAEQRLRGEERSISGAARGGYASSYGDGERARTAEQLRLQVAREFTSERAQQEALAKRLADYEERIADATARASAALDAQARPGHTMTAQLLAGATPENALRSQAVAQAGMVPGGPSAEAILRSGAMQALAQGGGHLAGMRTQNDHLGRQVAAAEGGPGAADRLRDLRYESMTADMALRARASGDETLARTAEQLGKALREAAENASHFNQRLAVANAGRDVAAGEGVLDSYRGLDPAARNRESRLDGIALSMIPPTELQDMTVNEQRAEARRRRLANVDGLGDASTAQLNHQQRSSDEASAAVREAELASARAGRSGDPLRDAAERRQAGLAAIRARGLPPTDEAQAIANFEASLDTPRIAASNARVLGAQQGAADIARGARWSTSGQLGRYEDLARATAERHGIDPDLFVALGEMESSGNPNARSPTGVQGLYQVTRRTARGVGIQGDHATPENSIEGAARYIASMPAEIRANPYATALAYNRGANGAGVQDYLRTGNLAGVDAEGQGYVRKLAQRDLYGSGRAAAELSADQAIRSGALLPESRGAMIDAEMLRGANAALADFARATRDSTISLANLAERNRAGSTYERGLVATRQGGEAERIRQEQAAQVFEKNGDTARAALARRNAETAGRDAEAEYREGLRGRFTDEGRQLDISADEARFRTENWWLTSDQLAAESTRRSEKRRLKDTYGDSISEDELESRANQSADMAKFGEIARQNQLIRDSFLGLGQAASQTLDAVILKGGKASEVMSALLSNLASRALQTVTGNLFSQALSFAGNMVMSSASGGTVPAATGHVFDGGGLVHMATGGVVDRMTFRPMAQGGTAVIGEAGPEAVIPLVRTSSGNLGVRMAGGGGGGAFAPQVTINMGGGGGGGGGGGSNDPGQAQAVGRAVSRALEDAQAQYMVDQQRVGGLLNPLFAGR